MFSISLACPVSVSKAKVSLIPGHRRSDLKFYCSQDSHCVTVASFSVSKKKTPKEELALSERASEQFLT